MVVTAGACMGPAERQGSAPPSVVRMPVGTTSAWRTVALPTPPGASDAKIDGLSCSSPGNCVAAGDGTYGGSPRTFTVNSANGKWGQPQMLPVQSYYSMPTGVSCAPDGSCVVIGYVLTGKPFGGEFAATERHGHWSVVTLPAATPDLTDVELIAVTCVSDGNCVAVGDAAPLGGNNPVPPTVPTSYRGYTPVPVIAAESGWTWHLLPVAPPAGVSQDGWSGQLQSVACSQPGDCVATGYHDVDSELSSLGSRESLTVAELHGQWQRALSVQEPAGSAPSATGMQLADLNSVSCVPGGACMAVGGYLSSNPTDAGLVVSGTGGSWGPAQEMLPALGLIGCTTGYCVGVTINPGAQNADPPIAFRYAHGHWGAGEPVTPPYADQARGGPPVLEGLACFPGSGCIAGGYYVDHVFHPFVAMDGVRLNSPRHARPG
jgi:hypothetical protein